MCLTEKHASAFFSKKVYWTIVPFLALAMIVTTAVAGIPGIYFYWQSIGREHADTVLHCYTIVTLATIALEGLFFFGGIWLVWRLIRRITALTDEMQSLTRSVLHDLSTPIAHIQHQADLLGEATADEAAIKAEISASCAHILKIVRLSAEISRTYEGLDLEGATTVDFAAIVRDSCAIFEAAAAERGLRLACHAPNTPVDLNAHSYRLQRLVGNLIDNAIKFTPPGGEVIVTLTPSVREVTLTIADTGVGMTAAEQSRVFERFYRADKSRHQPGSGLGLTLVHAIVGFYHGNIAVDSAPGRGTTFTVTLPRQ